MIRSRKDTNKTTTANAQKNNNQRQSLFAVVVNNNKKPKSKRQFAKLFRIAVLFMIFISIIYVLEHGYSENFISTQQQNTDSSSMLVSEPILSSNKKSLFLQESSKQVTKKGKNGQILHREITSIRKDDISGLVDEATIKADSSLTYEQALIGRERIVAILNDAGVVDIDVETLQTLPKWEQVTKLYGERGPVIIGLETCEKFRTTIPLDDASIGTAGMFNTGTNPFAMYLEANCVMPHNIHDKHGGMRWQVPWGKHTLASRKWNNTAGHDHKVNKTNVLPVVLVRDPYSWMQSMCKHPYAAKWRHTKDHCPNLVPTPNDMAQFSITTPSIPVTIGFNPPEHFDSLAHVWSEWYRQYLKADYPRLMVRFEDLQFHAKEMIDQICQCAGAVPKEEGGKFTYIVDSGKWGPGHKGSQTNMITAMIKYGTDKKRFTSLTKEDMVYAQDALDTELMQLFQYEIPSV